MNENNVINLMIFEEVMGATRERLSDDVCGLLYDGQAYPCFNGHAQFPKQGVWEAHYAGPDFCSDLVWAFAAEDVIAKTEMLETYMELMVKRVCPNWNSISKTKEVVGFWFALAHAGALERANALGKTATLRHRQGLAQIVKEAIGLAQPIVAAEGEARRTATEPFLEFVQNLKSQRADELLAVMYLGRGDHPTLAATLRAVEGTSHDLSALGHQMAGKVPLVKYLRDRLAKLKL